MNRPGVSSTLIGTSKVSQFKDNLSALDIKLTVEQIELLDQASNRVIGFADTLVSPEIRKMVYGGNDVTGWLRSL